MLTEIAQHDISNSSPSLFTKIMHFRISLNHCAIWARKITLQQVTTEKHQKQMGTSFSCSVLFHLQGVRSAFEKAPMFTDDAQSGHSFPYKEESHSTKTAHEAPLSLQNSASSSTSPFNGTPLSTRQTGRQARRSSATTDRSGKTTPRADNKGNDSSDSIGVDERARASRPGYDIPSKLRSRKSTCSVSAPTKKNKNPTVLNRIKVVEFKNRVLIQARALLPLEKRYSFLPQARKIGFPCRRTTRNSAPDRAACPLHDRGRRFVSKTTREGSDPVKDHAFACAMALDSDAYIQFKVLGRHFYDVTEVSTVTRALP